VRRPPDPPKDESTVIHEAPLSAALRMAAAKPFLLEQVAGPGAPRQFTLELEETLVGRSLQATISVEGNGMSRQHVSIKRASGEFTFTDLNSANGVFLNGVKTHSAVLRQGDTVQMGDAVFVFREGG
jgi:pSer/pThr/pTyr-binding forkhead associated (FHA) protein